MLDDIVELVLDLAVELGSEAKGQRKKKKAQSAAKTSRDKVEGREAKWRGKEPDPWDLPPEKPPWEK